MADLSSAIQMVNDLVTRLDRLNEEADRFDVGTVVIRLDVLHRMLVNLDIDQELVDTVGILHESANIIERSQSINLSRSEYHPTSTPNGRRGRPAFEISREQLSFLLEQGFKIQEISAILGVGKRTVERRMASFDLSVTGKCTFYLPGQEPLL